MSRPYAFDPIKLAADLGIGPEERSVLLIGGDHSYNCRCDTCREWWKMMGPDPVNGKCGSFTMEELGLDPADYPEFLFNVREGPDSDDRGDDLGPEFWQGPFSS